MDQSIPCETKTAPNPTITVQHEANGAPTREPPTTSPPQMVPVIGQTGIMAPPGMMAPITCQPGVMPQMQGGVQYVTPGGCAPPHYYDGSEHFQMQPAITVQPGVPLPPGPLVQPQPVAVMPTIQEIPGVPSGLEYLSYIEAILIHQIADILEMVSNWEISNRYVLKNSNGQQAFYAFEESEFCERQCCGPVRGFTMHIVDNFKREVLTLRRDFKTAIAFGCGACACSRSCQNECTISSPSAGLLGTIRQRFECCQGDFVVMDSDGVEIFQIIGPCCCQLLSCSDKKFNIRTMNNGNIGAITKKWGGFARELFTDADTFSVNFPKDLDVKLKAVLLGATFLIDFMYFEEVKQR
ncbi:unnamed protein product [Caenorhabditis bovis]|uniref:Phospholipid scramblase n=1 Tax=Caenorhabditis bovis TaxID=2654633 RepID=A0A8S1F4C4_9PELO|nr:unnamed protein product [Caenorhabditis bovis]